MDQAAEQRFREFVAANSGRMIRIAFLVAGNQIAAEDLLQDALIRLYRAWPGLLGGDPPMNYVRRILYTTHVSSWRRRSREVLRAAPPEHVDPHDPYAELDERDELWRSVARLPTMQRAVILLRYYEDLDEAAIARALGISPGAVKTHASRAMRKLRAVAGMPSRQGTKELPA